MHSSASFWDRIAERYAKKPVADEDAYRQKLTRTQHYFRPDMKVLEFGSGTGSTALVHAPHVKSYTAIDASSKMIEIARRKLSQQTVDNLTFEVATLDDYATGQETFDAILGLNVLHLLPDREVAIRHTYDLLKPGGVFVSNTACLGNRMGYFRYIAPIGRFLRLLPLVRVFSRQELEDSLLRAGFVIEYKWVPESTPLVYFIIARKPG